MSDDFKPNWDPNKHDSNIPKQEEVTVAKFACSCGCNGFVPVYAAEVHIMGPRAMIQLVNPPHLKCVKCGNLLPPDQIVKEVINARKGLNQPHLVPPQKGKPS